MLLQPLSDFLRRLSCSGSRKRLNPGYQSCERLEDRVLLTVDAQLLKDINTKSGASSRPDDLFDLNGVLLFTAGSPSTGHELWKSDGTAAGTVLVKEINPGPDGLSDFPVEGTVFGGSLYFSAYDGVHGYELWKSDGTEQGTVLVKDINPGKGGSYPSLVTNVEGQLYFAADDGIHGKELWKTDGTEGGTVMVQDIQSGPVGSDPSYLTSLRGQLIFKADDGVHGTAVWKSDATGTSLVKDLQTKNNFDIRFLTPVGNLVYFSAVDGFGAGANPLGAELWKTDGTEEGTVLVKDINPGPNGSNIDRLTDVNGTLFFSAQDGVHGFELWKSNGTAAGTTLVKDINPGDNSSSEYSSEVFPNGDGSFYFRADDGVHGTELWKSDGTEAGTLLFKDIRPGKDGSYPAFTTRVGSTIYFVATDDTHGAELWKSDGTEAGTVLFKDIKPGKDDEYGPSPLASVGGTLFFGADDKKHGKELWVVRESNIPGDQFTLSLAGSAAINIKTATPLDSTATLTNVDPNAGFADAKITVSIAQSSIKTENNKSDKLSVLKTGSGAIKVSGSNVTLNGVKVAKISGGTSNKPLIVTFLKNATAEAVNGVLKLISAQAGKTSKTYPNQLPRKITVSIIANGVTRDAAISATVQ